MNSIAGQKTEIRKQMKSFKEGLLEEEYQKKSKRILEKVILSTWYQNAECLLVYISVRHEVDTAALIFHALAEGKQVAVPKVMGKNMEFFFIQSMGNLSAGFFQIPEPDDISHPFLCSSVKRAVMLAPGVAFGKNGERLGYGGGFYDRYLEKAEKERIILKVGLCFQEQLLEALPTEAHDKKMDLIITDSA